MGAQSSKPDTGSNSSSSGADSGITLSQSLINKITPPSSSKTTTTEVRPQDIDTYNPHESISADKGKQEPKPSQDSKEISTSQPTSSLLPSSIADTILPSSRQSHLDSNIRSAISSELSRLRKQESEVQSKIQAALEEENLAIEKQSTKGRSAIELEKDLAAVKEKISRNLKNKDMIENDTGIKNARQEVLKCYKDKQQNSLDCWKEVQNFSRAVEEAEKNFIASLK
ncbi:unnamed protein product [Sympodiomycopsis kandeliae]